VPLATVEDAVGVCIEGGKAGGAGDDAAVGMSGGDVRTEELNPQEVAKTR
jgi:hypothetical protein